MGGWVSESYLWGNDICVGYYVYRGFSWVILLQDDCALCDYFLGYSTVLFEKSVMPNGE